MTLNYARLNDALDDLQSWKCLSRIQIAWVEELWRKAPLFWRRRKPWNVKRLQWRSRLSIEHMRARRTYAQYAQAFMKEYGDQLTLEEMLQLLEVL